MTTFLLVRHAAHGLLGRVLAGRMPGLRLSEHGRAQAEVLAQRLQARTIDVVCSSVQPRAVETAQAIARRHRLEVSECAEFDEIDFGRWTGMTFDQLRGDPAWITWNDQRSAAGAPGGELFTDVQRRALAGIERLRREHGDRTIVVASHGDVIKAIVAGYLGLSLDHVEKFDIAPASVSIVEVGDGLAQVKAVNT